MALRAEHEYNMVIQTLNVKVDMTGDPGEFFITTFEFSFN